MKQCERNKGLDFVKGLCILGVVCWHTISAENMPTILAEFIRAFFLNCFFCVSGYLFYSKEVGSKNSIKNKFVSLIIPYVSFSILAIIVHGILAIGFDCREISKNYVGVEIVFRDIFCMFSGIGIGTLWFLPVLFITYTLMALLAGMVKKKSKRQIIMFLIISLFLIVGSELISNLMWHPDNMVATILSKYKTTIHRILFGLAYTIVGYLLHEIQELYLHEKFQRIVFGVVACVGVIVAYVCNYIVFFQFFVSVLVIWGSLLLFDCAWKLWIEKIFTPVLFCGRHSLEIMIYHYIFLLPVELMILKNTQWYVAMPSMAQEIALFVINIGTTVACVLLFSKIRIVNVMLGRYPLKRISSNKKEERV